MGTLDYYNVHSAEFLARTVDRPMAEIYAHFLPHVLKGGRILDAGCGSGRDSKAFSALGYKVSAFDASRAMVQAATELTGLDVKLLRFEDLFFEAEFDGVWACASLLHLPQSELIDALFRLQRALTLGGVLYASFKTGAGERIDEHGRFYTDQNEQSLRKVLAQATDLRVLEMWQTLQENTDRADVIWLNAVCQSGPRR